MVCFTSQPQPKPEPEVEDPQLKNPKHPFEISDFQTVDFSFADSLLDLDSMLDWFDDKSIPDMAAQENNNNGLAFAAGSSLLAEEGMSNGLSPPVVRSTHAVKVEEPEYESLNRSEPHIVGSTHAMKVEESEYESLDRLDPHVNGSCHEVKVEESEYENLEGSVPLVVRSTHEVKQERPEYENLSRSTNVVEIEELEYENLGTSGCVIEEGMEKISLADGCGSSVRIGANGIINCEIITNNENDGDHSSETESSSSPSSTSLASSSSSSDSEDEDVDDDEEEDEQQEEKEEGVACLLDIVLEEGEIRNSDGAEATAIDDNIVGEDDDEDNNAAGGPIRSKNEVEILPLVPPVDSTLEPHHQMLPVGVILSIMDARVIVEGVEKHDPLNEGSILWMTESRTPLGYVDEIFGPVKNPYYIVRYNSENEVPAGIHGGTLVSFVPEFANHVLDNKDLYKKGYDASGLDDEEVSEETEFSDDEKEAEYKRKQRMTKRGNDQNPGKSKNNRKKVSQKQDMAPTYPVAPPSAIGQGCFGPNTPVPPFPPTNAGPNLTAGGVCPPPFPPTNAVPNLTASGVCPPPFPPTNAVPNLTGSRVCPPPFPLTNAGPNFTVSGVCASPFPPSNVGPNLNTSGIWMNGTTLPRPQSAVLPNGFPTNCISWYPDNSQISQQLPVQGIQFQQPLNPGFPMTTVFPGIQPNIFAPAMYAQGFVGQNQTIFGLSSPFTLPQPPAFAGQQGFLSSELQSETNRNLGPSSIPGNHPVPPQPSAFAGQQGFLSSERQSETNRNLDPSSIPGNHPVPRQFNAVASASRGRRTFHRGGRRGRRPPAK